MDLDDIADKIIIAVSIWAEKKMNCWLICQDTDTYLPSSFACYNLYRLVSSTF